MVGGEMMKKILVLIVLGGLVAGLVIMFPEAVLYVLGVLTVLVILGAGLWIGSWWSARLMHQGADIALKAQISDDQRDVAQFRVVTEMIKVVGRLKPPEPNLPQLEDGQQLYDSWQIDNLPENDDDIIDGETFQQ
jgi:hypothetical protein